MRFTRLMLATLMTCSLLGSGPSAASAATKPARGELGRTAPTSRAAVIGDDNIPGVATAFSPSGTISITGTLSDMDDFDDVFKIYLYAGEVYDISLTGANGTDFGVYVYGPTATDVYEDYPVLGVDAAYFGGPASYPRAMNNQVIGEGGYHYVDVWNWYDEEEDLSGGSGEYTLTITCKRPHAEVKFTSTPATTPYGVSRTVTGYVDGRFTTMQGNIYLYYSFDGLTYMPLEGGTYDGVTPFSFQTWYQWRKTWYMVVFQDADTEATASKSVAVNCYTSTGTPVAPATMTRGRAATVYGYLWPRHTAGTYPVRLYKYRLVNGAWKSYGYTNAKAANFSTYTKYYAAMSLPYAGSWKIRAYAPADSQHAATWSPGYDYITVK